MITQHVGKKVRKAPSTETILRTLLTFRGQRNEIEKQLIEGARTTEQVQLFINHRPIAEDNERPSKLKLFLLHYKLTDSYQFCLAKDGADLVEKLDLLDDEAVSVALDNIPGDYEAERVRAMDKLTAEMIASKSAYYHHHEGRLQDCYETMITWEELDISEEELMMLRRFGVKLS